MKIETKYYMGNEYGEHETFILVIDGKVVLEISPGEPEDNTFNRDLNFVFQTPDLLKIAFEAGKRNEEISIHNEKVKGEYE